MSNDTLKETAEAVNQALTQLKGQIAGEKMETATLTLKEVIAELGLSIESTFIPWSQSRNASEKNPSLNWWIRLVRNSKEIVATDYSAGMAHCPSYKQNDETVRRAELVAFECGHGYPAQWYASGNAPTRRGNKPLKPNPVDVVASLVMDADVFNYASFEDWAESLGYETDSRKAEKIYYACLNIALALRNGLGEDGLAKLQEAAGDY